jgi:tetratricopeptide (TPR) repeat protein
LIIAVASVSAQQAPPSSACGGGRTIDDYLADIAKSQKKKRNKNPFPDSVCVWGWCKGTKKPPEDPLPNPQTVGSDEKTKARQASPPPGTSSSKQTGMAPPPSDVVSSGGPCDPQQAAKDVEVGDYYFDAKNYRAALSRYKLALESWPEEPAIHFRAAKSYEELKDRDHATAEYQSVIKLVPNTSLAQEAQSALSRLSK